jgi:hypothetical protein
VLKRRSDEPSPAVAVALHETTTRTRPPVVFAESSLDFNAYVSSAPAGTCFYADDASITID